MSSLVKIADHAQRAKDRLIAQFREKPNIEALLDAFVAKVQELEETLFDLLEKRALATALGAQLDGLGRIIGLERSGLADDKYRQRLAGHVRFLIGSGTPEDLYGILDGATFGNNTFRLIEELPAGLTIKVLNQVFVDGVELARLLNRSRGAGIRSILEWFIAETGTAFMFDSGSGLDQGYFATASADGLNVGAIATGQWGHATLPFSPVSSATRGLLFRVGSPTVAPLFVAFGDSGNGAFSTDAGRFWQAANFQLGTENIRAGATDGERVVIGGATGGGYSTINFPPSPVGLVDLQFGTDQVNVLQFEPGVWFAGGNNGKLSTSPDGLIWTARTSQFGTDAVLGFVRNQSTYIAFGKNSKLSRSVDGGATWSAQVSGFGGNDINSGADDALTTFVIVGQSGFLASSPDGITWTLRTSQTGGNDINKVIWVPELSLFVLVGVGAKISTSPDGITWTARNAPAGFSPPTDAFLNVFFGGGLLVAVTGTGKVATSPDGIVWTHEPFVPSAGLTLRTLAFGSDTFIAGGDSISDPRVIFRRVD